VGYYISNEYEDPALASAPPPQPVIDKIRRTILFFDTPRVTHWPIQWDIENTDLVPPQINEGDVVRSELDIELQEDDQEDEDEEEDDDEEMGDQDLEELGGENQNGGQGEGQQQQNNESSEDEMSTDEDGAQV
jgi:hypothetical protein